MNTEKKVIFAHAHRYGKYDKIPPMRFLGEAADSASDLQLHPTDASSGFLVAPPHVGPGLKTDSYILEYECQSFHLSMYLSIVWKIDQMLLPANYNTTASGFFELFCTVQPQHEAA